jgi:hypothetical protein
MPCPSCAQNNQAEFQGEMMLHFNGLRNLEVPGVMLFPRLLVCLDCGSALFTVPEVALVACRQRSGKSTAAENVCVDDSKCH